MCGIVGYIGYKIPLKNVLKGLKNLEYRGYDSAGIAYIANGLNIVKTKGRIATLEEKLDLNAKVDVAISHTRWATHGEPNEINAHPHNVGKITVVHNGILENYEEIKKNLITEGINFESDTDTEVIAAVVNKFYNEENDMSKALQRFIKIARGTYALGIIVEGDEKLYIAKKDSPLIVAISDKGYYIASDVPAVLEYTNNYILLNDYEYGVISKDSYKIYSQDGLEIRKEQKKFEQSVMSVSKNGFDHFMLKEIFEEEMVCKETFDYYLDNFDKLPDISKYKQINIIGCGSTYNVGLVAKQLIESNLGIKVNVDIASEYRYKNIIVDKNELMIFISQSGETADTLAALKKVKELGLKTLGIINVVASSIAREADEVLYTKAGIEIAVATTKAYLSQLIVLILMVIKGLVCSGKINEEQLDLLNNEIKELPEKIKFILDKRDEYIAIAKEIYENEDIFYIGRGIDYAITYEAALKLKEVSYIHCEAYAAGELKHGTISLVEDNTPVIGIITDESLKEKTLSNLKEVDSRGAKVIVISNEKIDNFKYIIEIPKTNKLLQSILTVLPLQLIAYETAKLRNCDIDKPKNLAKSVTVE